MEHRKATEAEHAQRVKDEKTLAEVIDRRGMYGFLALLQNYVEDHWKDLGHEAANRLALTCWSVMGTLAEQGKYKHADVAELVDAPDSKSDVP